MPSTTPCALRESESCTSSNIRNYHLGKLTVPLCSQCSARLGVRLVVNSCLEGGDVESLFKDIMTLLAKERRPEKGSKKDED